MDQPPLEKKTCNQDSVTFIKGAEPRVPVRPAGCLVGAWSTSLVSQVGVLRRRERTFWRKLAFRVHRSTVSAGRRALKKAGRKNLRSETKLKVLVGKFAFGSGCPSGLGKGGSRVTPSGAKVWKVVFCVSGSTPFTESGRFACTGAPVPWGVRPSSFPARSLDQYFTCTGGKFLSNTWGNTGQHKDDTGQHRATQEQHRRWLGSGRLGSGRLPAKPPPIPLPNPRL